MTDRLTLSVTDRLLITYRVLLQHLYLCYSSCVQSITGFYTADVNVFFVADLTNKYFTRQIFYKSFFEWLSVKWQFASLTFGA